MNNKLNSLLILGNHIRELRLRHGLSQEEFAYICGLDRTYISGIERGKRNVSFININQIATALELTLSELFVGIEDVE